MNLEEARRAAEEAIRAVEPHIEVVAAIPAAEHDYTELIIALRNCSSEPCTVVIGARRTDPADVFRAAVLDGFRRHRSSHLR
jgi:hypothetical protein